jgi:ribosome-associated toxin RatA of RatAB toxin-antitoxin module
MNGRARDTNVAMPKSSTTVESFVSPEEFREVVLKVEDYPKFIPEVKKVEVLERTKTVLRARFFVEVSVGGMEIKTEYTSKYSLGDKEIRWVLESSPTLSKNEGMWRLEETKDGETRAYYESELVTTLPVPEEMQKIFADQELPKMMQRFRDRAEA